MSPIIKEKCIYFACSWIDRKLNKVHPLWSFLGANDKPHSDLLKSLPPPPPPPKKIYIYQFFSEFVDKLNPNIENLQKDKFTTKVIYTILEQQKNVRPRAGSRWGALGHKVTSWARSMELMF